MEIELVNALLAKGEIDHPGLFPHIDRLQESSYQFHIDFGLNALPTEPGIMLIRGARQYGKSTWLEQRLKDTIEQFGAGTAFYLNGDNIGSADALEEAIDKLLFAFTKKAVVRRLFIDEITAIVNWEMALKRMADQGRLANVLVVTTGSKATDLRRGAERLPGRKGKLNRTSFLFTPIAYREFKRVCGGVLGDKTLTAYILSGGSPIACTELANHGRIPEYVIQLVRDWIEGEVSASGRTRGSLINIFSVLNRMGGCTVGQAKLAREAGLANNTVAAGYIALLNDLGCVLQAYPWDPHRNVLIFRKECKYHFTNLLAAVAYHGAQLRSPEDFLSLDKQMQGTFFEWTVAQEILRRNAIYHQKILEPLAFWQNKHHEIDFVYDSEQYFEVKRGQTSALEFSWFVKQFPGKKLTVINDNAYETEHVVGQTLETFLLESAD